MRTAFTDLVGVRHPIVGFNRSPGVVAAVANAGGFGVLGASAYAPAQHDAQLTWIDEQTGGQPYGVDLLVPEKFATGAGVRETSRAPATWWPPCAPRSPPGTWPSFGTCSTGTEFPTSRGIPSTTRSRPASALTARPARRGVRPPDPPHRQRPGPHRPALSTGPGNRTCPSPPWWAAPGSALRQIEAGVDLLIAQGTEAGGHTGTIATMVLTPEIVDIAAGRPVLAAGGIASGHQMAAALALGAAGVWCGSVWLSSEEDMADRAVEADFLQPPAGTRSAHRPGPASPPASCAAPGTRSGSGRAARRRCPCHCSRCWSTRPGSGSTRLPGRATRARSRLESFFVGQVVGSFAQIRPGRRDRRINVAECEQTIRELAELGGELMSRPQLDPRSDRHRRPPVLRRRGQQLFHARHRRDGAAGPAARPAATGWSAPTAAS